MSHWNYILIISRLYWLSTFVFCRLISHFQPHHQMTDRKYKEKTRNPPMISCSHLYSSVKCINQRFPAEFPGHHPLVLQFLQAGGLMAGAAPTATRAMALNFGMLAFNASAKATSGCGFLPDNIGKMVSWPSKCIRYVQILLDLLNFHGEMLVLPAKNWDWTTQTWELIIWRKCLWTSSFVFVNFPILYESRSRSHPIWEALPPPN